MANLWVLRILRNLQAIASETFISQHLHQPSIAHLPQEYFNRTHTQANVTWHIIIVTTSVAALRWAQAERLRRQPGPNSDPMKVERQTHTRRPSSRAHWPISAICLYIRFPLAFNNVDVTPPTASKWPWATLPFANSVKRDRCVQCDVNRWTFTLLFSSTLPHCVLARSLRFLVRFQPPRDTWYWLILLQRSPCRILHLCQPACGPVGPFICDRSPLEPQQLCTARVQLHLSMASWMLSERTALSRKSATLVSRPLLAKDGQ